MQRVCLLSSLGKRPLGWQPVTRALWSDDNSKHSAFWNTRLAPLIAMVLALPSTAQLIRPPPLDYKRNKFSGTEWPRHPRMENSTGLDTWCYKSSPAPTIVAWWPLKSWSCCKMEVGWLSHWAAVSSKQTAPGHPVSSLLQRGDVVSLKVFLLNERFASTLAGLSFSLNDAIN